MKTIRLDLLQTVLCSSNVPPLFGGTNTHDPALKLVGQLVPHTQDVARIQAIVAACLPEAYGGDTLAEVPGMIESAIAKGFDQPSTESKSGKPTQAELAIKTAEARGIELCHDQHDHALAVIPQGEKGKRAVRVESRQFRRFLRQTHFKETGKHLSKSAVDEAVDAIEAQALFGSDKVHTSLRHGGDNERLVIDLGDDSGLVVEITADGWNVSETSPVLFERSQGFGALPRPVGSGELTELKELLGLDDHSWLLLLGFLINALRPGGPFMLMLISGEQGAGKSWLCSVVKRILDPNGVERLRMPRSERDLMIQAGEHAILIFDNASNLKWDMSDALCSLATGASFATRKLYSDADLATFTYSRPVGINGIGDVAHRPDLLERSIRLHLPAMKSGQRRTESELWAKFERILPGVLGALYDVIAIALRNLPSFEPPTTVRMADPMHWIVAAEPALGVEPGTMLRLFEDNQRTLLVDQALNDPVILRLLKTLKRNDMHFEGTMGELHEELVGVELPKDRYSLGTPAHLSTALERLQPAMRKIGIIYEPGPRTRRGRLVEVRASRELADELRRSDDMPTF